MRTRKKGRRSLPWLLSTTTILLAFLTNSILAQLEEGTPQNASTQNTKDLCRVENGHSSLIVDIAESVGNDISQTTNPKELPITGDIWSDIELILSYPTDRKYFALNGKQLKLIQPLDRDEEDISSIVFQVVCTIRATGKQRSIPIIARISDLNDNNPKFLSEPYEVQIQESAPVGSIVFRGIRASDIDSGVNGLIEYFVVNSRDEKPEENGFGFFTINYPHQGIITLNRSLDYEKSPRLYVTVVASDRAFDPKLRLSSTTTLTVNVIDADDHGPAFVYTLSKGCQQISEGFCTNPKYNATVTRGVLSGVLDVLPERIQAIDRDSIRSTIRYSFVTGSPPSYLDFFHIDPQTAVVRQIRPIESDEETHFEITIGAEEQTEDRRSTTAQLFISVLPVDNHPPVIQTSALVGYVKENSPLGTTVLSVNDHLPVRFVVSDPDLSANDPKPSYRFELTTQSFRVNEEGILVVNIGNLDRDAPNPNQLQFQMIAREIGFGESSSSPLVMKIQLIDMNDNLPLLPNLGSVTIPGGDGKRPIYKISGSDIDEGINAKLTYTLHHISNNGKDKFIIDSDTGMIYSRSKLNTGESYSLTVQVTDGGGRSTQEILEVVVVNGPNLKAPIFSQVVYDISISEGASIGSELITLEARDPEGKSVIYEIVGGNELKHWTIGKRSGIMTVNGKLDREDLSRYSLTVKAEDEEGLYQTAQVNIRLSDINDQNPEFTNLPYEFSAKEGKAGLLIGRVEARDGDEGKNGEIRYEVPSDSPISVNPITGEVQTITALDFEHQKRHLIVIKAKDLAQDTRIATATLTINVEDDDDEMPMFNRFLYEVSIPENAAKMSVIRVEAIDPDTSKKMTYVIKQGPYNLFAIDPVTGEIFTKQGLDYERENKHILIVGTEENDSGNMGSTTTVVVSVEDTNDVPPVFTIVPRPIRLEDTAHIGMVITKLEASDSDGTAPGNKVKYDLVGRGKASRYFDVDHDSGVITIKDDLRKEMDTEYQLDIRAYDLGEPQLSSVATVKIYVDHVATVPPDHGVGFAENEYSVEIPESSVAGKIVKKLTIVNKPNDQIIPIECEIYNEEEEGLFEVSETEDKNCIVTLKRPNLDFEKKSSYKVHVRLHTLPGVISKKRVTTTVFVRLLDENDNMPEFVFPDSQKVARGRKFYAAISEDAQISTSIVQIKATDKDSPRYSDITFDLDSDNPLSDSYFRIDPKSGIVSNARTIEDISPTILPFKLNVRARDSSSGDSQMTQLPLIINKITDSNRLILIILGSSPDKVKTKDVEILSILQEASNLIIGIEKITAHKYLMENGTIDNDPSSTDVWFYAIDSISDFILDRENPKVVETILSRDGSKTISYFVSSSLGVRATEVRKPLSRSPLPPARVGPLEHEQRWAAFPAGLVSLAGLIFIVGIGEICFICYKWSRYTAYKNNQEQRIYVSPRQYEPVYMEHSPSLKPQYETQMLQMRVNGDAESDLQMDLNLNKNHVYNIEQNFSNILGGRSNSPSRSCQTEATTRAASDLLNYPEQVANRSSNSKTPILKTFQKHNATVEKSDSSITNPIFERSDDDEDISICSHTNENVHFREKKEYNTNKTTEL